MSLAKGIEIGTNLRMSQVVAEVLPGVPAGVLTGPNLAREVAQGHPAACVVALPDESLARRVQALVHTRTFRTYMGTDVVGCEIAGATKNVMAIAAGIGDGLGLGDNTRAVLITRGLAELGRLGVALGGKVLTFGGLAGVGDLVATCASPQSRNRTVGFALGEGRSLDEIVGGMHMVAEGVKSAGPLVGWPRHGVEMPIAEQVQAIVEGRCSPPDALMNLMKRPSRPEWDETLLRGLPAERALPQLRPSPDSDDGARREAALAHVKEILLMHGATEEEIDQAVADGVIDLFVAERMLVPSRRRYSRVEVAELTGVDLDKLERFWRALGFANVDDDDRAFTDLDLEAVRIFQGMQALGATDTDTAVQMARVIGSSMARIAEAELVPGDMVSAEVDPIMSADAFASVADETIPAMARLLEFVWRRQVAAGIQRSMVLRSHGLAPGQSPVLAVGFADMVGFTLLSQHLSDQELAAVVRRFEEISHDIVTSARGRVVKMIGDEVMFVVDSVADAARIGLDLADAYADDDLLSDVRVGLACGPVLLRDGDYFGPTVNLAHRIVNIGNPGTVLMSDEFHTALMEEAPGEFTAQALRPRLLKDLGRVQLWWCGRAGQEADGTGAAADRRRNVRWERLSEVLRDLEELRGVGERLLTANRATASVAAQPGGGDAEGS